MIDRTHRPALLALLAIGGLLLALAGLLTLASERFGYDWRVIDMPVLGLVAGLMAAGALYLPLAPLIRRLAAAAPATQRHLLLAVFTLGLAMRAVLMASEPALEDDWQRYLWDGGVVAHGLDPYAASPADARAAPAGTALGDLARAAGKTLERVNHPELRTIYPPLAEGAFALAHALTPWRLLGWRALLLLGDIATFALLVLLLRDVGRSPLWASLYWWNPLALKEIFNSAHMEAVLLPLVLGALVLAARRRAVAGALLLTLAAGVKLWPILLAPLVLRPLMARPARLLAALVLMAGLLALMAWPMVAAGLDSSSGLMAYAQRWQTNSALMPALTALLTPLAEALRSADWPGLAGGPARGLAAGLTPGLMARGLVGAIVAATAIAVAIRPWRDAAALTTRAMVVVGALVLLSPAQFPWYALWVAPFLAFHPLWGFLLLALTMPLYYSAFHLMPRGAYDLYSGWLVWLIWSPTWALLLLALLRRWRTAGARAHA